MGETLVGNQERVLQDFEGIYVGFGPTDDSGIGIGEMELTISEDSLAIRMATGTQIIEESGDTQAVRELSGQEIMDKFYEGADISGVRIFDVNGWEFIFFQNLEGKRAPVLLIRGGMGDELAPTKLFSPKQIAKGRHEKTFKKLESKLRGPMPRLSNGGVVQAR